MVLAAAVLCAARIVVTHTMGMMPVYGGDGGYSTMMREPGSPYGGLRRMRGLGASGERYRSGYRWDLEMAERQGVDVFGVLLSGNERSRQFWLGWLRTWTEMRAENPSLRIRLAPLFAGCDIVERRKDPGKFAYFRDVWNEYRDSPAWYRVDRRVMFVGYKSSMWWDARANSVDENVAAVEEHRAFFEWLGIGRDAYFVYDGPEYVLNELNGNPKKGTVQELAAVASAVADGVEGYVCWGGVIPDEMYRKNYPPIAAAVHAKGKKWGMPILWSHSLIGQFHRSLPGVQRLYDTWDMAERTKADIALLVTWNDWNETTSFAPGTSLNYALADLNAKLIHRFKTGSFPKQSADEVFLFYRKYHADADPWPFVRGTVERDRDGWGETDDVLDVSVFAVAPGTAEIRGTQEGVATRRLKRGFNRFLLKTAVGKEIAVRVVRDGKTVHELVSPERVTDRPWREDLLPWGWSSGCRAAYDRDFGPGFRPASNYAVRHGDGIEDWFRLYWWGTTDLVPGSGPNDDPDGDGFDNLAECRMRTNPLERNHVYASSADWDTLREALGPNRNPRCAAPMRINSNPYPDAFGSPTHGFLFAEKGTVYAPKWMSKWNNDPRYGIGWCFRSGRRHSMRLGDGGGIALEIDPALAAVYRFLPPVDETYAVSAELSATGRTDLRLKVRLNGREIATLAAAKGGKASLAPVQVCARRLDRIDFAVEGGDALAAGELVPRVSFAREARR